MPLATAFAHVQDQQRAGTGARPALQRRRPGLGRQQRGLLRRRCGRQWAVVRAPALQRQAQRPTTATSDSATPPPGPASPRSTCWPARAPARPASRSSTACAASACNVVAIGDTTCGKPVGFLPQDDSLAARPTAWSISRASTRAARAATSTAFSADLCGGRRLQRARSATTSDPLLVAAAHHADNGACPAGTAAREQPQSRQTPSARTLQRRRWRRAHGHVGPLKGFARAGDTVMPATG